MSGIVGKGTRSRIMSSIRGKNTKPEITLRKLLHSQGVRFRLHRKDLMGKPDLVLPKYKLVIFVHGCFWHQHIGCYYASKPSTNVTFWKDKLESNVRRDLLVIEQLKKQGWRVAIVWECGLKHVPDQIEQLKCFITGCELEYEWPIRLSRPK